MATEHNSPKIVRCPTCGTESEWSRENPWRPFCRERCKLIDLGEWASENHRIPETIPPDFSEHDPDDNLS